MDLKYCGVRGWDGVSSLKVGFKVRTYEHLTCGDMPVTAHDLHPFVQSFKRFVKAM
jgi:hypothetical protein